MGRGGLYKGTCAGAGGVAAPQGCSDGAARPAPGAAEGLAPPGSWRGWGTGSPCVVSPPPLRILVRRGAPPQPSPWRVCLLCACCVPSPPTAAPWGPPGLDPAQGLWERHGIFFWGVSAPKSPIAHGWGPRLLRSPPQPWVLGLVPQLGRVLCGGGSQGGIKSMEPEPSPGAPRAPGSFPGLLSSLLLPPC